MCQTKSLNVRFWAAKSKLQWMKQRNFLKEIVGCQGWDEDTLLKWALKCQILLSTAWRFLNKKMGFLVHTHSHGSSRFPGKWSPQDSKKQLIFIILWKFERCYHATLTQILSINCYIEGNIFYLSYLYLMMILIEDIKLFKRPGQQKGVSDNIAYSLGILCGNAPFLD